MSEFVYLYRSGARPTRSPEQALWSARIVRECIVADHAASRAKRYSWCSPFRIGVATTRPRSAT